MRLWFTISLFVYSAAAAGPVSIDVRASVLRSLEASAANGVSPESTDAPPLWREEAVTEATEASGAPPATKELPNLDVRDQVLEQLLEGNAEIGAPPSPDTASDTPNEPVPGGRAPLGIETRPDWFEGELSGYRDPNRANEKYVPVPHKTLTIRSLEDIGQVGSELRPEAADSEARAVADD